MSAQEYGRREEEGPVRILNRESEPRKGKVQSLNSSHDTRQGGQSTKNGQKVGDSPHTSSSLHAPIDDPERLREMNDKLRKELRNMAILVDQSLAKDKDKRMKRYEGNVSNNDPELSDLTKTIKEKSEQLDRTKNQIVILKRQLDKSYRIDEVQHLEDEVKRLAKDVQKVRLENQSNKRIQAEQNKTLGFLKNEEEYAGMLKHVKDEMNQAKTLHKDLLTELTEKTKQQQRQHERIRKLEESYKALEQKLKEKTSNPSKFEKIPEENELQEIEEQIKEKETKKKSIDDEFAVELKMFERHKKDVEAQTQKLSIILREKEKEIRLFNVRIKEMKKIVRFNSVKPLNKVNASSTQEEFKESTTSELIMEAREIPKNTVEDVSMTESKQMETNEKVQEARTEKHGRRKSKEEFVEKHEKGVGGGNPFAQPAKKTNPQPEPKQEEPPLVLTVNRKVDMAIGPDNEFDGRISNQQENKTKQLQETEVKEEGGRPRRRREL